MEKGALKRNRNAIISILAISIGLILGINIPKVHASVLFYDDFESYEVGLHYPVTEYGPYYIDPITPYFIITNTGINNSKALEVGTNLIVETKNSFGNNNLKETLWVKINLEGWMVAIIYISGNSNKSINIEMANGGIKFDGSQLITGENIGNGKWIRMEITLKDPHNYDYSAYDEEENLIYSKQNNYIEESASLKFRVSGYNGGVDFDNVKIEQVTNDDLIIRDFISPEEATYQQMPTTLKYQVEYYNGDDYYKYYSFVARFYDANTNELIKEEQASMLTLEPTEGIVKFKDYTYILQGADTLPTNRNYKVDIEVIRYDEFTSTWTDHYRDYTDAYEFSAVAGPPPPNQPTPIPAPEAPEIPTESEACTLPENPTILNYVQTGICKAFYFLFIPNETQREDLSDGIEQAVGNITDQKPIGYIKQIYSTWKDVKETEYTGEGIQPVEIPVVGTIIKDMIAILLWVAFAKYIVKRIGSITL